MNLSNNYWWFKNAFTPEQCDRIIKMGMQENFELGDIIELIENKYKKRIQKIYLKRGTLMSHG